MNKNLKETSADYLFKAIMQLKSVEECYSFFEDLCTAQELKSIAQRLYVAKLLYEKHIYNDIVEKTGASTATISRVNRSLQFGNDSYAKIFERLKESESANEEK